nr:phosphotransferase [Rhodovibrio salinarum]
MRTASLHKWREVYPQRHLKCRQPNLRYGLGHNPPDIGWLLARYREARAALEAAGVGHVPCMNDTLAGNFMLNDRQEIMLVDFEYASNNDPFYELGLWFGEMFFPPEIEAELLEEYFGRLDPQIEARVWIGKALADMKWSTWAMVQSCVSKLDFDFHKYGVWKHMRARQVMHDPRWESWLRAV